MKQSLKGVLIEDRNRGKFQLETEDKTYNVRFIRLSPELGRAYLNRDVTAKGFLRQDGETFIISKLETLRAPIDQFSYERIEDYFDSSQFDISDSIGRDGKIEIDEWLIAS